MGSVSEEKPHHTKEKSDQRNALICQYLTLVPAVASKYYGLETWEELISVGTIGLIKAVDSFDVSKGCNLSSYAWICISNEINMFLRKEASYHSRVTVSGADAVGSGNSDRQDPVFEEVSSRLEHEHLEESFHTLSPQEQEILRLRFGLKDGQPQCSQEELAELLGISQSYTSRIVRKCLLSLQQKLAASGG